VLRLSLSRKQNCQRKCNKGWGGWNGCGARGGMGKRFGGRARFFGLQNQGLKLLQAGTPESIQQARALFLEQLSMFEHPTPIYNVACCEALLGNSGEAIAYLHKAVAAGFTDASHIENDNDLSSLRNLDEFKNIVATLKSAAPSSTQANTDGGHGHGGGWRRWCGGRGRFYRLHGQGIKLMESGTPEGIQAAKALFQEQLTVVPDAPSPLYNLACCEALLGNSAEAISFLQKAVKAGFSNASHMENDSDLKSVRDLDEFKAIVQSLKPTTAVPGATTPVPPLVVPSPLTSTSSANPSPIPSAPAPVPVPTIPFVTPFAPTTTTSAPSSAPSAPASSPTSSGNQLQILETMGFIDRERTVAALNRANGDLTVAIQILLEEQNHHGFHWF